MTSLIGKVASLALRGGGALVRKVRSATDPSAAVPAGNGCVRAVCRPGA